MIACHFGPLPLSPQWFRIHAGIRAADGVTFYIESRQVGTFRVETDLRQRGLHGEIAVSLARSACPVLLPYCWEFPDGRRVSVDPGRHEPAEKKGA